MPKKSQPPEKQQLLTFTAYGRRIGVSQQRVSALVKAGQISSAALVQSGRRQLIDPSVADVDLNSKLDPSRIRAIVPEAEQRKTISAAGFDPDNPDYQKARALNEYYKAALKKIEYEAAEGQLVPVEQVERDAFDLARQVRDSIMNIPNRIADQLATMNDRTDIIKTLTNELSNSLEKLAMG